jgi:hypothetical protein
VIAAAPPGGPGDSPGAGGGPGGGAGGGTGNGDGRAPVAKLGIARTTLQNVLKRGFVPVTVTCDEDCAITLRGEVVRKLRKRLGGIKVASGKGPAKAGRRTTLKLKLTRKARKGLRRQRSFAFTLKATASDAAGNQSSASRKAKIKRKR